MVQIFLLFITHVGCTEIKICEVTNHPKSITSNDAIDHLLAERWKIADSNAAITCWSVN